MDLLCLAEVGVHVKMDPTFDMRIRFSDTLNTLLQEKSCNTGLFTTDRYRTYIEEVKQAKVARKKSNVDYRRLRKYDVITVDGKEKLIMPITGDSSVFLYYVHIEQLFDLLHETHLKIGHGGRTRMEKELRTKYKNVSKEVITLYLSLCKQCRTKSPNPKKDPVAKQLIFKEFNSRCQVDVLDMQSNPDGEYKFILNYRDHLTKFMLLRPLKSKTAAEVANQLLDIFTVIGVPRVLLSNNGKEFANQVIFELKNMWSEVKLVHEESVNNEGSIEHVNRDVSTWMQTNESTHWAESLRFIQFSKNRSFLQGIQQSSYEAMFSRKPKVGRSAANLPKDLDNVEQQTENAAYPGSALENKANVEKECISVRFCVSCGRDMRGIGNGGDTSCRLCLSKQEIRNKRLATHFSSQPAKVLKNSDSNLPPAKVGDTVRVLLPLVGKSRDLAVILDVDGSFYKLGTEDGVVFKQLYSRSEFSVVHEKHTEEKSLVTVGRGDIRCNCSSKCTNKRCKCRINKLLCNSKCHKNSSCCCNK